MANVGRPSVWDKHAPEMQRMYEDDKLSRGEVARRFGTSVQTVTRVLERHGVVFEDRPGNPNAGRSPDRQAEINVKISAAKTGVPLGTRTPAEMRTCEECGREYEYRSGRAGERFCSRKCRTDFQVKLNQDEARADYDQRPKLCPCGGAIPYEYRHTRQFCSTEHRREYQSYRTPDPANYVTFDCLSCGKTVTRLKNYGGNMVQKYCSNECSAKHNRTKQHIVVEDAMVLDSPYEALFYGLMRLWKVPCERADRGQAVQPIDDGWYCPDFYLPGEEMWVEVKGFEDDDDRIRYAAWRSAGTGRKLAVLRKGELHVLRTCLNRDGAVGYVNDLAIIRS